MVKDSVTPVPQLMNPKFACVRYGQALETRRHRYYECPHNLLIDDDDVCNTNHFIHHARDNLEHETWYYRALLLGQRIGDSAGHIRRNSALPLRSATLLSFGVIQGWRVLMGVSTIVSHAPTIWLVLWAAVFIEDGDTATLLISRALGEQTVPTAEPTAFLRVLNRIDETKVYTIFVDAKHGVDGIQKMSNEHANGVNGDLWTMIYDRMVDICKFVHTVKVKSHAKDRDTNIAHGMDLTNIKFNALVDDAVGQAVKVLGRSPNRIEDDSSQHALIEAVAKRISAIEVQVWVANGEAEEAPSVPSDRKLQFDNRIIAIKRTRADA